MHILSVKITLIGNENNRFSFSFSYQDKKRLREATPDNVVVALQEELIAVKLREAEATLALKELRPKITELNSQWQRHLQVKNTELVVHFDRAK